MDHETCSLGGTSTNLNVKCLQEFFTQIQKSNVKTYCLFSLQSSVNLSVPSLDRVFITSGRNFNKKFRFLIHRNLILPYVNTNSLPYCHSPPPLANAFKEVRLWFSLRNTDIIIQSSTHLSSFFSITGTSNPMACLVICSISAMHWRVSETQIELLASFSKRY